MLLNVTMNLSPTPGAQLLAYNKILMLTCPTGNYCREDRCQSYFDPDLIPTARAPLEDCEASGALSEVGCQPFVIDAPTLQLDEFTTLKQIASIAPELIVIIVTFGSLDADLLWIEKIKKVLPSVPVGIRGAPCYVWSEKLLKKHSELDFCLQGEYEVIFREIALYGLQSARGVSYRKENDEVQISIAPFVSDLDSLPLPDRTVINQNLYKVRGINLPQASIRVQRGCPFPCTYCLVRKVSGQKARHRNPALIASEIESLQSQGINYFYFRADTFSLNRKWVLQLCQVLKNLKLRPNWVTTTRVEYVDAELLSAMKSAGCYGVSFGVDVASKKIGQLVKKPPKFIEAQKAMRLCDDYGIVSLAYIMIGFLWDTPETLKEAKDFLYKIAPDLVTVHYAHPYPGTEYHQQVRADITLLDTRHAQAKPAHNCQQVDQKDLQVIARSILNRHWRRPRTYYSLVKKMSPHLLGGYKQNLFSKGLSACD